MSFLSLFRSFILRSLWKEKVRSVVAALGIALGVAVMVAIRLANTSVTDTFEAAVDSVGGNASLRIRGAAGRFDELQLTKLKWLHAYGLASPVIEAYGMLDRDDTASTNGEAFPRGELLHVLGVDVLLDFPLRDYHVLQLGTDQQTGRYAARDALRLLDDPQSIILTEKFLRRHGLRVGDAIPITFGSRSKSFIIRGVLLNRGPARTLDGNFGLMDIAAAQLATDRLGIVDYVDIMLHPGKTPEQALPKIQQRLPTGLIVELPDAASGRADTMVAAFQFNLTALSAVALIVGLFLIYNTVAISVAARRSEIGMLQAVGASRRMILYLFLAEALLLSVVGVAVGIPAGRLLATGAVAATSQTVEIFYIANVAQSSAANLGLSWLEVLAVMAIAVPLALLAALVPAWEASTVAPIDAVRRPRSGLSANTIWRLTVASIICCSVGWLLTKAPPLHGKPACGFLAEMLFMLAAAVFTPVVLAMIGKIMRGLGKSAVAGSTELTLAAANLDGGIGRVSISVAALAVSLSMMIAIAIMVGSFRETVTYWLDSALTSDLSVKPVMQSSSVSEERLSRRIVETIRSDPDVADTVWFSSRQIPYQDRQVRLAITESKKTLQHGHLLFQSAPPTSLRELDANCVFVSESFANLYDADLDATIALPSPAGPLPLRVAGVYYDYASNQGTIMMDQATYQTYYRETDPNFAPQHLSIHLVPGADAENVRQRLISAVGEDERIYCVTNREVRQEALRIFESTFTITYALQLIAILVAGLGITSTLITMIYHRRRDIGLLSLAGATKNQLKRVFVFEAIVLGAASQLIGIVVGIILALVLIFVINVQSFGWTIQLHFPLAFLIQSTVLVILAAGLFGLYPAIQAATIDPLPTIRDEHA
jgi:putative ABC transport system permease protein